MNLAAHPPQPACTAPVRPSTLAGPAAESVSIQASELPDGATAESALLPRPAAGITAEAAFIEASEPADRALVPTGTASLDEHRAAVLRRRDEAEQLGDDITELAARIQAATYELLVMIRAFDQREGWSGFKSCAHWLNWRTGLALGGRPREGPGGACAGRPPALERRDAAGADLLLEGARPDAGGDAGERAPPARLCGMRPGVLRRAAGARLAAGGPGRGGGRRAAAARAAATDHLGGRRRHGGHPRPAVAGGRRGGAASARGGGRIVCGRRRRRRKRRRPASGNGRRMRWGWWPRAPWRRTSTGGRRGIGTRWCCM